MPELFRRIVARLLGARTAWIDSIASSDRASLSGACARHQKPLTLLPQHGALAEHRADHRTAPVRALSGRCKIYGADDEADLGPLVHRPLESPGSIHRHPDSERLRTAPATFIAIFRLRDAKGPRLA